MTSFDARRRFFLKRTASSLALAGAAPGLALAARPASAQDDAAATQTQESQAAMTPQRALQKLEEGNARFVSGNLLARDYAQQVADTADGQYPFAAILSCIDSRAPDELLFDQGVGDIFTARVAGNFVNDDILGSLEFACALAGAKLIVVVGHSECGAIRGACDDVIFGNLTQTLANIKPAVAAVTDFTDDRTSANAAFVQAVADRNVLMTLMRIRRRSPILSGMIESGQIGLVGAMYDVRSGVVTFMNRV